MKPGIIGVTENNSFWVQNKNGKNTLKRTKRDKNTTLFVTKTIDTLLVTVYNRISYR